VFLLLLLFFKIRLITGNIKADFHLFNLSEMWLQQINFFLLLCCLSKVRLFSK